MGQLVGQINYLLRPWNTLERRKCIWKRRKGVTENEWRRGQGI